MMIGINEIGCQMRNILIKIIRLYQKIPGNWHYKCRYTPTCSNYAIEAIKKYAGDPDMSIEVDNGFSWKSLQTVKK